MHSLSKLLAPDSIAVVGASEGPRHGGEIMRALAKSGYRGRIVPVNPRHTKVYGHPCISEIAAIDAPVDCVVLAVRRDEVVQQIAAAGEAGTRSAVVISGGFREAGDEGVALERELVETARRYGMRLLGPNTIGFINLKAGVGCYGASLPANLDPGGIAAIVQSGTVAGALGGAGRGMKLSHLVSTGNEADVGVAELLDYFAQDPDTRVILLFIETLRDADAFRAAAMRARASGKPVVVLRAGSSSQGRRITQAHTGALADDPRAFAAFARHCGLIMVRTLDELIVTGELLSALADRLPLNGGLAVMTHSGGEAAMFVDIAAAAGLKLPPLSDASVERLRSTLPSYHIPANPLDTTGSGATDRQVFRTCLEALCDDTEIGIVGVMQDIRADHWVLLQAAEVSAEVARGSRKPIVFFSNTTRHVDPQIDSVLAASGVPVLYGTSEVVTAISAALSVGLPREESSVTPPKAGQKAKCAASAALASGWASELLTFAGVESIPSRLVSTSTEAHAAARSLGFPLVLKAIGAGLEHKSEAGAVRLGIADETELANALDDFSRIVPSADGLLVQRMIEGAVAELIVGIQRDPVYGWTVVVGAGGTLAELLDDVVVRIAPVSETEARQMLSELRQFRLLDGFRGRPRGDIEAAAAAVSGISRLAPQLEGVLSAFEINPLAVLPCGGGAVALDTLAIAAGEMR